ncbi:hypothetical protein evm_005211 [Chilo suppressalis]|nr:hypothetical protein evm_005211 [Chilo suppressalis]
MFRFKFLLTTSLLTLVTYAKKDNVAVAAGKSESVPVKNVFETFFTTTDSDDDENESTEVTVILSSEDKQPVPTIVKPTLNLDITEVRVDENGEIIDDVKCKHYKRGADLDIEKISDVWQVVYYKLKNDISCFRIQIKRNTYEDKKSYYEMYGNLSNTIDWNLCHLEIVSSDNMEASRRKHFLYSTGNNRGVMDNIIIEQHKHYDGKLKFILFKEIPDQWLVVKNVLLMRDCESGGIVVFSRVPHKPRREDILDALMVFGEDKADGKMHCNNDG